MDARHRAAHQQTRRRLEGGLLPGKAETEFTFSASIIVAYNPKMLIEFAAWTCSLIAARELLYY